MPLAITPAEVWSREALCRLLSRLAVCCREVIVVNV
jgi:hypothetical protein